MKQQEVFKKIGGIIKELSDQYEYLKTADEPLNELELELFLANSHFLTDHMVILSKLNAQATSAQKEAEKSEQRPEPAQPARSTTPEPPKNTEEPKYFEPLVQSAPASSNTAAVAEIKMAEEQAEPETNDDAMIVPVIHEEPETIRHELIIDEADLDEEDDLVGEPLAEAATVAPVPEPAPYVAAKEELPPATEKPDTKPATEQLKPEVQTLNERMSAQMAERNGVASQINMQPISDLKAAINMNDKLLYVKDLFNGYSLAYSEAVEILNRFSSFEEADLFLKKNYVAKNNWEGKPETTDKFYSLLKRRYA